MGVTSIGVASIALAFSSWRSIRREEHGDRADQDAARQALPDQHELATEADRRSEIAEFRMDLGPAKLGRVKLRSAAFDGDAGIAAS